MLLVMAATILVGPGCGGGSGESATTPATSEPASGTEPALEGGPAAAPTPTVADQVAAGQAVWAASCEDCHKYGSDGGELVGQFSRSGAKTAADLVAFIQAKMPKDKPGSLSEDQAWAVTAAILSKTGQLGDAALTPETAATVSVE